jgi:hypothetical protein
MTVRLPALMLLLGLALASGAGCKKDSEPASTGGTTVAASEVRISDVQVGRRLGANSRIADATDKFGPRDTIYVVAVTEGSAPNATVTARWTYEDGQVVKEDSRSIAPGGTEATEFHISKPSGWPKGKYKVAIAVGGETETKEFEVR